MVLIIVGTSLGAATSAVNDRLLQRSTYAHALDRAHAYRRIYSEVLTDPQIRDSTEDMLGDLHIGGRRSIADTTALSNAITRLALPPSALRTVGDRVIHATLRYLRGDTDRLDADIDLSAVLELDDGAQSAVAALLQDASTALLDNLPAYEKAVRAFADELASGLVPTSIPIIGGDAVGEDDIIRAIESAARFGLSPSTVSQIVAAVRSGDDRDALVTASASFLDSHLRALTAELRSNGALRFDLIDALGRQADQPQQRVIASLNSLRNGAAWFPPWLILLAPVLGFAGLVLIASSWGLRRRTLVVIAIALSVAAGAVWIAAALAAHLVPSPLERAASSDQRNGLPPSVIRILSDVERFIADDVRAGVDQILSGLVMLAALALAIAAIVTLLESIGHGGRRQIVAFTASSTLAAGALVAFGRVAPSRHDTRECNGHRELCGRPYDEIVQAATHNAMSSPDVVQIWPEHDGGIAAQLNFGIRTLLIDTHYWPSIDTPAALSTIEQAVPADLAAYLFDTLNSRLRAHPGTYLCHSRCAYGAIPLTRALTIVKHFLDSNRDEVVTLVIENGISTDDTEIAFRSSGLDRYLYDGDPADGWPTLGELIDHGQRLVVFAENAGPPPPWYHSYGDLVQDTGFHVKDANALSCSLERGRPDAPLFMMNHWIQREAPDRADAQIVNQRNFIVDRARRCASERGRLPNFIAVNFFSIGDVIGAVDTLNGSG